MHMYVIELIGVYCVYVCTAHNCFENRTTIRIVGNFWMVKVSETYYSKLHILEIEFRKCKVEPFREEYKYKDDCTHFGNTFSETFSFLEISKKISL